jgi:hypothetical protein
MEEFPFGGCCMSTLASGVRFECEIEDRVCVGSVGSA